nr:hypothetical protein [Tanacetum cinerariifolium]
GKSITLKLVASQPSFKLVSTSQHLKQLPDWSNLAFSINWSGCGAKGSRLLLSKPFQPGVDGRRLVTISLSTILTEFISDLGSETR